MMQNQTQEFQNAMILGADRWVPACGGTEIPFEYAGTRYLYVFNPNKHEHAYLNLDTDLIEPFPPFVV
jgi:hypothetical protein